MRFHKIIFQTDAESFIFLSWKNKKVLFLKKYNSGRSLKIGQESSNGLRFAVQIFREGFVWVDLQKELQET